MEATIESNIDDAEMPIKNCVEIRGARKRYSPELVILNGLNMTVQKGTIYSLLGPSGCGKTILLHCIVGRTTFDSGSIRINVNTRSDIGFMPQTLSLFLDLTIYENLLVFGYFFSMTKEQILSRADKLLSYLELPSGDRIVNNLSGGQQRRVSLAVAFIHDPKILILDEPTVGLDIYLVQCIWDWFTELSCQGKTIIFTTQYNQEALRAHKIGFMRNGVLLTEEQPQALIQRYNCSYLEDAFLALCRKQENEAANSKKKRKVSLQFLGNPRAIKTVFKDDEKKLSAQKLKGVLYKNFLQLKRSYAYIFMVIVLPLESLYSFNAGYGHKPEKLHLAAVNDEIPLEECNPSLYSHCFLEPLESNSILFLSCLYIDLIRNKTYEIDKYENQNEALDSVKKNKAWGMLYFPKNYTSSLIQWTIDANHLTEENFQESSVNVLVDSSDQVSSSFVKTDILVTLRMFLKQLYSNCGLNPKFGDIPIHFQDPLYPSGTEESAFLASVSPAGICVFCFSFAIAAAALGGAAERSEGTMERMLVAGVSLHTFLAGFMIIQIIINTVRGLMLMAVTYLVFDNPQRGNYVTLNWLMFMTGVLGTLWGITLAVIWENVTVVVLAGLSVTFIFTLTTGLLWPMEGQHRILKAITWMFPLTWTVKASEAIAFRNDPFTNAVVLKGFGITGIWICIFFALINFLVKLKADL